MILQTSDKTEMNEQNIRCRAMSPSRFNIHEFVKKVKKMLKQESKYKNQNTKKEGGNVLLPQLK